MPQVGWTCVKCGVHNFKKRDNCFKCKFSRDESDKTNDRDGFDQVGLNPCNTLIFRGLDALTTEESLDVALRLQTNLQSKNVRIIRDPVTNTSRGYGFCEMNSIQESTQVTDFLTQNNVPLEVDGKQVLTSYAKNTFSTVMAILNSSLQNRTPGPKKAEPVVEQPATPPARNKEVLAYLAPDVSTYQFDKTSGYYCDPSTGLYYDASSQVSCPVTSCSVKLVWLELRDHWFSVHKPTITTYRCPHPKCQFQPSKNTIPSKHGFTTHIYKVHGIRGKQHDLLLKLSKTETKENMDYVDPGKAVCPQPVKAHGPISSTGKTQVKTKAGVKRNLPAAVESTPAVPGPAKRKKHWNPNLVQVNTLSIQQQPVKDEKGNTTSTRTKSSPPQASERTTQSAPKQSPRPALQTVTQKLVQPATKEKTESEHQQASEPTPQLASEPENPTASEPTTQQETEPENPTASKPTPEQATESEHLPESEPKPQQATEPESHKSSDPQKEMSEATHENNSNVEMHPSNVDEDASTADVSVAGSSEVIETTLPEEGAIDPGPITQVMDILEKTDISDVIPALCKEAKSNLTQTEECSSSCVMTSASRSSVSSVTEGVCQAKEKKETHISVLVSHQTVPCPQVNRTIPVLIGRQTERPPNSVSKGKKLTKNVLTKIVTPSCQPSTHVKEKTSQKTAINTKDVTLSRTQPSSSPKVKRTQRNTVSSVRQPSRQSRGSRKDKEAVKAPAAADDGLFSGRSKGIRKGRGSGATPSRRPRVIEVAHPSSVLPRMGVTKEELKCFMSWTREYIVILQKAREKASRQLVTLTEKE
ncbi:proteoglycan 4-like isoform X2 [Haliotis rubra]|uniref:proteoglycan 4-like isoform X2 n=1 Tax=Haliotis rubra TaxID=36100 RepID=UPI001EE590A2|nr:proteoglycan 4-like isoform X2 [Haliotis rubra]